MSGSIVRAAIVLGTLAMVGPFAIDMYLPAMPAIAADLGVSETSVQATIIFYFLALVMLVISISPMLAPLAGSAVLALADWRAIFGGFAAAALISLLMTDRLAAGAGEPDPQLRLVPVRRAPDTVVAQDRPTLPTCVHMTEAEIAMIGNRKTQLLGKIQQAVRRDIALAGRKSRMLVKKSQLERHPDTT